MSPAEFDALSDAMALALQNFVAPLVQRIAILEARPIGVIDGGVYQPGQSYGKAVGVTHDGGFWVSQEQTNTPPGNGNPSWRLAVSRGKTGREGKRGAMGPPGPPCQSAERMATERTGRDIQPLQEAR